MTTATVRDSDGTPYVVTNTVRDAAGASYDVDAYVRDSAGNPYLIFGSDEVESIVTGGGVDTAAVRRRNIWLQKMQQDDELMLMIVKEYMKYTL